jgi:uncharacterized membrane protein (DUF2068 family)
LHEASGTCSSHGSDQLDPAKPINAIPGAFNERGWGLSRILCECRGIEKAEVHNLMMRAQPPGDRWLLLIAVFKLIKSIVLVAAGVGALRLLHRDVAEVVERWIDVLRVDPDNRFIHSVLVKVLTVNDRSLKEISAGTFAYAALFLTEGTGLLLRKRWAQYFTIIVTGSLLPLEVYELMRHASVAKLLVILLNVAIIGYLVVRLRRENKDKVLRLPDT